jgi:PAS domain-containing protein
MNAESDQITREIYAILVDFEEKERLRLNVRQESTKLHRLGNYSRDPRREQHYVRRLVRGGMDDFARHLCAAPCRGGSRRAGESAHAVIDTMPDHVYLKDAQGRYVLDNTAHRRYLGMHGDETVEGKNGLGFLSARHRDALRR